VLFHQPLSIDLKKTTAFNTPESFRSTIRIPKIDVLPLVSNTKADNPAGWCTYTYEHEQAPELEVICGGINSKTPKAGAIWRQGHLLHFGFEPSPDRMTEAGQALLVNSICYISRFTEDRPIVHTPCVFVQKQRIFDRGGIKRLLDDPERDPKDLQYYLQKETYEKLATKTRKEIGEWYAHVGRFLHADPDGKLVVDEEAQTFGVSPLEQEFFDRCLGALEGGSGTLQASKLLDRYAPEGPGKKASGQAWRTWLRENQPYLFFSDTGGYRWYVDPLAKKRGIPTAKVRGPARASLPSVAKQGK
jgi:hypothetical protein